MTQTTVGTYFINISKYTIIIHILIINLDFFIKKKKNIWAHIIKNL